MWLRTALAIALCTGALSACNMDTPLMAGAASTGALSLEMVEFQRKGGTKCPNPTTPQTTTGEKSQCASVKIRYPNVTAAGTPQAASAINQFIQTQLLEYSDDNGKQPASLDELVSMFLADYNQSAEGEPDWMLERSVDVIYGKGSLVTLRFNENGFTGGAHPFSGQRYFVMDSNTGKQVTLANLLAPNYEEALNKVGEKAFRSARKLPANKNLEEEGFWFENNTFSVNTNFGVTADGLIFLFNPYEVAPYALGATEFTVPYSDIRAFVPANSPLTAVMD